MALDPRWPAALFMCSLLAGCGRFGFDAVTAPVARFDASPTDGGGVDSSQPRDAGVGGSDGSTFDADTLPDSSGPDATADAGTLDAQTGVDAGNALTVVSTVAEIVVTSRGEFEIAFTSTGQWQPTRFQDLSTTGPVNLAGASSSEPKFNVLASPVGIRTGGLWSTLSEADMATATARQVRPDLVVVETDFRIVAHSVFTWDVQADYRIYLGRRMEALITVTAPTATAVDGLEFAYTNVDPSYQWNATIAGDSQSFVLAATAGAAPRPQLTARTVTPSTASRVESDILGNWFFQTDITTTAGPGNPLDVRWELEF